MGGVSEKQALDEGMSSSNFLQPVECSVLWCTACNLWRGPDTVHEARRGHAKRQPP